MNLELFKTPSAIKLNPKKPKDCHKLNNEECRKDKSTKKKENEYELTLSKFDDPSILIESTIINDGTVLCNDLNEVSVNLIIEINLDEWQR